MMRYPTVREKKMRSIEDDFTNYLIYDKYHDITTAKLKEEAPIKAKRSFEEWNKLYDEQKEEDSKWPFV